GEVVAGGEACADAEHLQRGTASNAGGHVVLRFRAPKRARCFLVKQDSAAPTFPRRGGCVRSSQLSVKGDAHAGPRTSPRVHPRHDRPPDPDQRGRAGHPPTTPQHACRPRPVSLAYQRGALRDRRLARRAGPGDTAPEVSSPEDLVAVSRTPPARLRLKSSAAEAVGRDPRGEWP